METNELDKYIEDGYGPVERFYKACEEMPTVKFILAERKISELLMTVATSSVLQSVVSAAARGFDFRTALSRSRIRTGKRYSILPPAPRRELIAYAMNLLYAIDVKAIPLQEFIEEYYWSPNGINFSFKLFAHGVILPLKASVEAELAERDALPELLDAPAAPSQPEAEESEPKRPAPVITVTVTPALSEVAVADLIERIADVCDAADAEGCPEEEKKALYAVSTALAESVKSCDAVRIRTDFDAFAEFVRGSSLAGRLSESTDNLNETLEHYGI